MAVVNNTGRSLYYAAAGDEQKGRLAVQGFVWTGIATTGDLLTFADSSGDTVLGPFTGTAGQDLNVMFKKPIHVDGLATSVLGSGTVNVFLA